MRRGEFLVVILGLYYSPDQWVAYHVGGSEVPESNAFDAFKDMQGMYQTGTGRAVLALSGQVYLGDVDGDRRP